MHPFLKIFAPLSGNIWEKLLKWYQNSLIKELLDHFNTRVFSLEFGVYDNFTVSGGTDTTVRNIIIGMLFGMIIAACLSAYNKNVYGKFIRELIKRESFSPESALTLQDCGVFRSPSVRGDLLRGGSLAKLTRCVQRDELEEEKRGEFRPDFLTAKFYIPEDLKYRAEFRYDKKGFGKMSLVLTVAASVLTAYLLCRFLPALLTFADWLMTALAP